jgi:hypothetical protein
VQEVVADVKQTVSLRPGAEDVGLSDIERSQTNSLLYGINLTPSSSNRRLSVLTTNTYR